ncbi:hypothetical protein ACFOSY_19620 [Streptomyces lusitanus]|uniref:Uncharacterized protein n=1 Tax=Streptomyces lusitanus TaxID=68232 RepID=A0ABU3JJW3_9ACTN|nr:hypothetical protein [Streptomyces lusitanus]
MIKLLAWRGNEDPLVQANPVLLRWSERYEANTAHLSASGKSMVELFRLSSPPATQVGDPDGFCSDIARGCR